ncbi:hypothetical protein NC651_033572 [Populus alba x Populus x berolinensis]|nr:hypothetical protein NC651_033572 [Populus alba x Populus x berolinensis]
MGEESVGRGAIYSLLPTDLPTGFIPSVNPSAKPSVIMTGNRHVTARTCYSNPSVIPSVVLTVHPSRHRYGSGISRVRAPVFNSVGDSVGKITRQTLRATARPFFIDSEFSVGNYRRTMSVGNYRPNYRRIFAVGDFGREIPTEKIPSVDLLDDKVENL